MSRWYRPWWRSSLLRGLPPLLNPYLSGASGAADAERGDERLCRSSGGGRSREPVRPRLSSAQAQHCNGLDFARVLGPPDRNMFRHRSGNGPDGAQRREARESAASGLVGGDPDAALHTGLGTLGERQTRFLILRADCQPTVRRGSCARSCPTLDRSFRRVIARFLGHFGWVSGEFPSHPESGRFPSPRASMCLMDKERIGGAKGWNFAGHTRAGLGVN